MRRLLLLLLCSACGRTELAPRCEEPTFVTFRNAPDARYVSPTLLPRAAFQHWDRLGQFFDWKGQPLGVPLLLPGRSPSVSPLSDGVAVATRTDGRWTVQRVSEKGVEPITAFDGPHGYASAVEANGEVHVRIFDLPVIAAWADAAGPHWLSADAKGPTRLDGVEVYAGELTAATPCGDGSLAVATVDFLSQQPLRSRLALGRMKTDGTFTRALEPIVPEDRFAWMPALRCDSEQTRIAWIENVEGVAGGLVAATRLMLRADGVTREIDATPGAASYQPNLSADVLTWIRYGDDGYSTHLLKLRCE